MTRRSLFAAAVAAVSGLLFRRKAEATPPIVDDESMYFWCAVRWDGEGQHFSHGGRICLDDVDVAITDRGRSISFTANAEAIRERLAREAQASQ